MSTNPTGPHCLVYVHFYDLEEKHVEGIYVHPIRFATPDKAHEAASAFRASIAPLLTPSDQGGGGLILTAPTHDRARAYRYVLRLGARLGWRGDAVIDLHETATP
jgi:hypothetical protein